MSIQLGGGSGSVVKVSDVTMVVGEKLMLGWKFLVPFIVVPSGAGIRM